MQKFNTQQMNEAVNEAYEKFRGDDGGKNADYIPFLANVPSQLFGISVCLPDGEIVEAGDTDYVFGIESVSKVPTAVLAMQQYGPDTVLDQIGADATGLPFNSIMAILLENDHPSTPLVNAGAIAACSMVKPVGDASGKWKAITDFLEKLCGSPLVLQDELYKSESETNFNNRSIAWLLKNYDRIYDDPDMSLDIYTRQCSMGVTARQLSICGGTIANRGVNPVTHARVFDAAITPKIVSMIATVGFYEHTGDWIFSSGQDRRGRRDRRRAARRDGHRGVFSQARRLGQLRAGSACDQVYHEQARIEPVRLMPLIYRQVFGGSGRKAFFGAHSFRSRFLWGLSSPPSGSF